MNSMSTGLQSDLLHDLGLLLETYLASFALVELLSVSCFADKITV